MNNFRRRIMGGVTSSSSNYFKVTYLGNNDYITLFQESTVFSTWDRTVYIDKLFFDGEEIDTTTESIYRGDSNYHTLIGHIIDENGLTDVGSMFEGNTHLYSIDKIDTKNVTEWNGFCYNCTSLVSICDLSFGSVGGYMTAVFGSCSSLINLNIYDFGKNPNLTSFVPSGNWLSAADRNIMTEIEKNMVVYNSFDRIAAGYNRCSVYAYKNWHNDTESIAIAEAKGYDISFD